MTPTYEESRELLANLWQALWPELAPEQKVRLLALPEPCHNHLQVRLRRPERGERLTSGCCRLVAMDSELFLEGLRLYPHAICRAAEAAGPLPDALWSDLIARLEQHRLWLANGFLEEGEDGFWEAVETLEQHRELPQPVLDFQEAARPREEAPLSEFRGLLHRFLIRARLEKLRFGTYAANKEAT